MLADNPLGDPHVRLLDVWLPPQYDQAKGRGRGARFPGLTILRTGTVDDLTLAETKLRPQVEQFIERRVGWSRPIEGAAQVEGKMSADSFSVDGSDGENVVGERDSGKAMMGRGGMATKI